MNAFMRAPVEGAPISMILKVRFAILPVPIRVKDGHIRVEQIPAMRPETHRQGNFLSQKIEIRIVRDFANYGGWSEQEAATAKNTPNRFLWSVLNFNSAAFHREHAIAVKLLRPHRINMPSEKLVRRRVRRWIT